jgi:uncharacterized protein (DUF608 family)
MVYSNQTTIKRNRSMNQYDLKLQDDPRVNYSGENCSAVDFPIGAMGGGVIRMNGKAERAWWQIFHNFEERKDSGKLPNSFFAIRTECEGNVIVRALQTVAIGSFHKMQSLRFQAEYPFGWYIFEDPSLPVQVSLEVYNPFIPMDMKNSAIPCGLFKINIKNPTNKKVSVSILATQQNAVGFTGYDQIKGPNLRECEGYGKNKNQIKKTGDKTILKMSGQTGSMCLSTDSLGSEGIASWSDLNSLYKSFNENGCVEGDISSMSTNPNTTVDGALLINFKMKAKENTHKKFQLSWHFPGGDFGRKDIPIWNFLNGGQQYENWWKDANEVDHYLSKHFNYLDSTTRLFHKTLYSSNIPRYVIDRMTSNLSVLKSPTCFWTKNGYFGIWESTSDKEEWFGNCKHVIHYAQGHARLFPELGKILRKIDLESQSENGLFPDRDGGRLDALDGHFGTILGVYREHLLSDNNEFLKESWNKTKRAMNYIIHNFDQDKNGMLSGSYHNTLDCNSSGTSPWMGTLYIAALKACIQMADIMGEENLKNVFQQLSIRAIKTQNSELWSKEHGYYVEKPENLPDTRVMQNASGVDMFLGQWWANQLDLGQIYPIDRTLKGLKKIFINNKYEKKIKKHTLPYRAFLGKGDVGWQMFVHPDKVPSNSIHYYSEVMSGFEYSFATTMMQYGLTDESLQVVKEISQRYNGRLRGQDEVSCASNATVFGTGSPIGEDECGDYYARALSSWSLLLAMQGFHYDGPKKKIAFKPIWKPDNHVSFFSTAKGWGLFSQKRVRNQQEINLELEYGELCINTLTFEVSDKFKVSKISVNAGKKTQAIKEFELNGNELVISLKSEIKMNHKKQNNLKVVINQ